MIQKAIDRILDLADVKMLTHDGRTFSTRALAPMKPPVAQPLNVSTLSGLIDWINSEGNKVGPEFLVHIADPRHVNVVSLLDDNWMQRHSFAAAEAQQCAFPFGRDLEIEEFIIGLQLNFQETPQKAALLKFVAHITKNEVRQATDDGISQTVVQKNEISRMEAARIDPIQKLKPYRTFREVEQPDGEFLLRIKQGRGELPTVALYSTGGVAWELDAIDLVHGYLRNALPERTIIR
jgi:hypothetical protein